MKIRKVFHRIVMAITAELLSASQENSPDTIFTTATSSPVRLMCSTFEYFIRIVIHSPKFPYITQIKEHQLILPLAKHKQLYTRTL